jgi:para-aminobenzoate synthetase component 1
LNEAALKFPDGGAIGFWSYEAASLFEPRLKLRVDDHFPLFRLVFYEKLRCEMHVPSRLIRRRQPLQLKPIPDFPTAREFYCNGVDEIKKLIAAGDIYQANLTHKFAIPTRFLSSTIYGRLNNIFPFGPAPRSALLEWDDFSVVSNSPETFLTLQNGVLESKPIKGTIARGIEEREDAARKQELQNSMKDRAENVMIVDLLRNDLGRVCEYGSVHVPQLFQIETFPTLHHGVSVVRGRLRANCDALAAFGAAFPCGSITGAPKIRAMEILSQLETAPRGVSMGAIGYFGFDGNMEWSVAIRTATIRDKTATFNVGGGIVTDSQPQSEYDEMRLKARALWSALSG